MTDPNVLVSSSEIDGTITTAGIQEEVLMSVDRKSVWSLTEIRHYATYNVVTKEVIKTYSVQELNSEAVFIYLMLCMALSVVSLGLMEYFRSPSPF